MELRKPSRPFDKASTKLDFAVLGVKAGRGECN
jgi:hypothetical protein